MANYHESERVEQVLPAGSAFQDGINILGQGCPPQRGLDGQVGPPGCLPYSAHISPSQEIPKVSMESTGIPVLVPSFWVGHGSQSLYKTYEASSDLPQIAGDQTSPVSGQHIASGRVPRSSQGTLENGSKPARGTRFLNRKKCVWTPTQRIEFLGFEKLEKIRKECKSVRAQGHLTVRRLAHLIGLLTSTIPAVLPAPLHYRILQRLSCHCYNTVIPLDQDALKDLDWWIVHATGSNGKPIKLPKAERMMESDASTTGWGASCQGVQTGGPWDQREAQMHINWLELKAAIPALETFAANWMNVHVLLLLDNRNAIALINKKGSPHSKPLSDLAVQLWEWCLARGITVRAEHIPGAENVRADRELRCRPDPSD